MIDSTPTPSGAVIDQGTARAPQPVVEADAGRQAKEARQDALTQAGHGTGPVAFHVEKVRDIVGLYLDPPERAVVLCVDEKSQIQALDRSQPILPVLPGVPERASHDYKRHGTSSLFAALDAASGKVIGSLHARHRAIEFKRFLAEPRRALVRRADGAQAAPRRAPVGA